MEPGKGLVQLSQLTAAKYKLGRALLDEAGDALAACLSLTPTAENVHQILACCEFILSGWNNPGEYRCALTEKWACETQFVPDRDQILDAKHQLTLCLGISDEVLRKKLEPLANTDSVTSKPQRLKYKAAGKQAVRKLFADESAALVTFQKEMLQLYILGEFTMEMAIAISYYPVAVRISLAFATHEPRFEDALILDVLLTSFRDTLEYIYFDRTGPEKPFDRDPERILRPLLPSICNVRKLNQFTCDKMFVDDEVASHICSIPTLTFFAARSLGSVHATPACLKTVEENSTLKGVVIESDSLGAKEGEALHRKRPDMDIKFPGFMHGFNWKKQ